MGDCYSPTFHLSDVHTYFTYSHNYTKAMHYTGEDKEKNLPQFFRGNTIINWAMFAAPRHPLYLKVMTNVVEIIKSSYLRESVVHLTRWDVKFKTFFCTTVFVLTYSIREMELENVVPKEFLPRISQNNFAEFGGNVKAISTQFDPNHYRNKLKKSAPPFLTESIPLNMAHYLQFMDGKAVMGDSGREIWLIYNGTRRTFGSYDTFLKMEFSDAHTKHVSDQILNMIPVGPPVDMNENIVSAYSKTQVHATLTKHKQNQHHLHHGKKSHKGEHPHASAEVAANTAVVPAASTSTGTSSISGGSTNTAVNEKTAAFLDQVLQTVNGQPMGCWGDDYGGTRDDYLKDQWEGVLKGVPAMVYPLCTGTVR
jgi:hypothetical protein